ncbi:MAG TPA: acylphosphatase [Bacteroidota bacterium]
MDVGARILVRGFVQGVGFRFFVLRHASRLGLSGYVQNHYNGDVEIEVEGNRSLVEELIKEVKVGPRSAQVADVKIEWKDPDRRFRGFEIR